MFLHYLRIIDKRTEQVEGKLHKSQRNQELIELLELEKCLVYFTTSLRSNEVVLEKLMKTERIRRYPEDEELLEDVIIENKQAIEIFGEYLQQHPQRNHGRFCFGNIQQPEYRHEIPDDDYDRYVCAEYCVQRLRHERQQQGNALCVQSVRVLDRALIAAVICLIVAMIFKKKDMF